MSIIEVFFFHNIGTRRIHYSTRHNKIFLKSTLETMQQNIQTAHQYWTGANKICHFVCIVIQYSRHFITHYENRGFPKIQAGIIKYEKYRWNWFLSLKIYENRLRMFLFIDWCLYHACSFSTCYSVCREHFHINTWRYGWKLLCLTGE